MHKNSSEGAKWVITNKPKREQERSRRVSTRPENQQTRPTEKSIKRYENMSENRAVISHNSLRTSFWN
jgi:hypothetical protein